jgi:hypothetical protein
VAGLTYFVRAHIPAKDKPLVARVLAPPALPRVSDTHEPVHRLRGLH